MTAGKAVQCRYRLVTGCEASYATNPGRVYHEKRAHADILVALTTCPECGDDCGDEELRGRHLANTHGFTSTSERRQELDARQVQEIITRNGAGVMPEPAAAHAEPAPADRAPAPVAAPSPNGHAPAPLDLDAVLAAVASLATEVETLRAENAALKADRDEKFRQIQGLITG